MGAYVLVMKEKNNNLQTASFALGCFWHPEEIFRKVAGVKETAVGFMGGAVANPSYELVCGGESGHAETMQIKYDPKVVSYEQLLKIFWASHNPTQVGRQGPDVGEQYRSVIFYHTPEQKALAEKSKKDLEKSGKYSGPIATGIIKASEFYKAEEYHQKYAQKQRGHA